LEDLQEEILGIYDTVADNSLWTQTMDRFVDRAGARGSIIFEWQDINGERKLTAPLHSASYSRAVLDTYLEKCAHLEARDQTVIRNHTGHTDSIELLDETVLASSSADLSKQEHVLKLRKLGIHRRAAGVLNKDNQWISLFSIQFGADNPNRTIEEKAYLAALLPHMAKALDLGLPARRSTTDRTLLSVMDQLAIGVCVLDTNGQLVHANEEFRRQENEYSAFIVSKQGALEMKCDTAKATLTALMRDAQCHGRYGARPRKEAIATSVGSFLCIEVSPLTRSQDIGTKPLDGYVVFSTDTSRPVHCNAEPMKEAFGLTDTELAVVDKIGEGLTNPEIAERRDRSVATINAQVKSILSKSQCSTRTQFVRLMMRFGGNFLLH
jgi:DNA-binding CsgD family transcriptional regulator